MKLVEEKLPLEERVDALVCDVQDIDADLDYLHERIDNLSEWMDELDDHCSDHCELIWKLCNNSDAAKERFDDLITGSRDIEDKLNTQAGWMRAAIWLEAIVIVLQLFNII